MVSDRTVLELGSGAGLVAALVSQLQQTLGGSVIATDFHDAVLERLEENLQYSASQPESTRTFLTDREIADYVASSFDSLRKVKTAKLDWSRPEEMNLDTQLDLIIASDVVSPDQKV